MEKTKIIAFAAAVLLTAPLASCDRQLAELVVLPDEVTVSDETTSTATDETEIVPAETTTDETADDTAASDPGASDSEADPNTETQLPSEATPIAPEEPRIFTSLPNIDAGTPKRCAQHSFIFNNSYHEASGVFIAYADNLKYDNNELFEEWNKIVADPVKTETCDISNINIYEAIKLSGFTRGEFEEFCYGTGSYYLFDLNPDVLFSSDSGTVETYYSSSGNYAGMMNRYGLLRIKIELENLVGINAMAEFYGEKETYVYTLGYLLANREAEWSIADFIYHFEITEQQLTDIIQSLINESAGREVALNQSTDGGRFLLPDAEYSGERDYPDIYSRINLDRLFGEASEETKSAIEEKMTPVLIDELICEKTEG